MIVRRTAVVAGALLLGVTCVRGASQVEADPHELYERARGYLADGELRGAGLGSRPRTTTEMVVNQGSPGAQQWFGS